MSAEVAALDNALLRAGEDVVLRRVVGLGVNQARIDVICRARVLGVKAEQVVGTIAVSDLSVIISPTQILAAQWPGGQIDAPVQDKADPRVPRSTDFMVIKGKQRQVKFSDPIFVGGEWVRCNLIVAG